MTLTIEIDSRTYEIEIDEDDTLTITVDGVWAGTGTWSGTQIEDCAADLGDGVYDALDKAIAADLAH